MTSKQGEKPDKGKEKCPCLRELSLKGVPQEHYCSVMGARTLLDDFDLQNKCVGLYEACDLYARHRGQESSRFRRRKPMVRRSPLYGALRLFL
ncbi:MAG: hypothetical protein KAT43_04785 [Nanoarchaeota archaeon]|nr:hypothetical protein [Nanoarchaeota archaeon]